METLERAKRCFKNADILMKMQQDATKRDEQKKPIGVKWNLKKHLEMFHILYTMKDDIQIIIEALEKL